MATTEINKVTINGFFTEKPVEKELFIEFYGDSILNGSNVYLGGTTPATSDATKAFGWLTAEKLNADCNIIGCGGLGLAKSGGDFVMGDVYNLNGSLNVSGVTEYDFARIPDAVVIELGVNDEVRSADPATYKANARALISALRSKYGNNVPIIWLNGYHDKNFWTNTLAVINELGGESANIYVCTTAKTYLTTEQGGDNYHPDVAGQESMANTLSAFIRDLLK